MNEEQAERYFLDSEYEQTEQASARFHIIPVPLEHTVSYKGGTARGPEAIISASAQLEKLTHRHIEPGLLGMCTHPAVDCTYRTSPEEIFTRTADLMHTVYKNQGIPILLGGEHSVTNGAIRFIGQIQEQVGILQFDAHMDLRDAYEGNKWSHASVMRRAVDHNIPLYQVGIRNYSEEELIARNSYRVRYTDAQELMHMRSRKEGFEAVKLPNDFPSMLYITFDVDAFDASLMPATGTPDPGGLFWWDALELVERLSEGRTIIGFDVVELAPNSLVHHCEYTAAKLTYALMGLTAQRNRFLRDRTSSSPVQ